jgi:preprotein translocase subunit SecD
VPALSSVCALWLLTGCGGFGVERYREADPEPSLALRFVAEGDEPPDEVLPRLGSGEVVPLAAGALLRAPHVAHVQLLDSAEGERVLVLQLRDEGRVRLREASAGASGRRVAVVAAGAVVATPILRGVLDQSELVVRVEPARVEGAYAAIAADD